MNNIKVLFFATLRQLAGTRSMDLEIPEGMKILQLRERLGRDFPTLSDSLKTAVVAINREFAFDDAIIPAGSEVALFPPVSGG